ncbi:MAG: type II toxin-antitoxin system YafQ family toxin [Verrucomicrobiae bacterium]|nr:type II toxin-antitoxin system YafQ family toxin [Verrucomicrobiae bacterium]
MRVPVRTNQFRRDVKLAMKRGKDMAKLERVLSCLIDESVLDVRLRDHSLKGGYAGRRECHIEPDWLLVYKLEPGTVIFERLGTHADLFE